MCPFVLASSDFLILPGYVDFTVDVVVGFVPALTVVWGWDGGLGVHVWVGGCLCVWMYVWVVPCAWGWVGAWGWGGCMGVGGWVGRGVVCLCVCALTHIICYRHWTPG